MGSHLSLLRRFTVSHVIEGTLQYPHLEGFFALVQQRQRVDHVELPLNQVVSMHIESKVDETHNLLVTGLLLYALSFVDYLLEDSDGIILDEDFVHLLRKRRIREQDLNLFLQGFVSGGVEKELMESLQNFL